MVRSPSQLDIGAVLDHTYELIGMIGSGGMGTVWKARHTRLPKEVAIKVLKGAVQANPEQVARFRREAEIASQLGHPHIVDALDFNQLSDGTPYLVLELLRGQSLRQRLQQPEPLSLAQTVTITRQVASALQAAHQQGVVHRDLKPENIFLCQHRGEAAIHVKILDFGISKIMSSQTALTHEGSVFGTPQYMSPEQAAGTEADARADLYALASIVYEMLAGTPPFVAPNVMSVLYKVIHEIPPLLTEIQSGIRPAVAAVIQRALAKSPDDRYSDINRFSDALTKASGVHTLPPVQMSPSAGEAEALQSTLPPGEALQPTLPSSEALQPTLPSGEALQPTLSSGEALQPALSSGEALQPTLPSGESRQASERKVPVAALTAAGLAICLAAAVAIWLVGRQPGPAENPVVVVSPDGRPMPDMRSEVLADARPPDQLPVRDAKDAALKRSLRPRPAMVRRRPPKLPPALLEKLKLVKDLLHQAQLSNARAIAEQLLRELPKAERWRAHEQLARIFCHYQRLGQARAHMANIPRRRRVPTITYCKRHMDFVP